MTKTWHIHIRGQVQGVGFRPFVYKEATALALNGWVNNTTDGLHVEFNATEQNAKAFNQLLKSEAPELAKITGHTLREVEGKIFEEFCIIHSEKVGESNLLLTPDFGICEECMEELFSKNDRRYGYSFITCTNCGPRYSIVKDLPYDRERTTMEPFDMCEACLQEYSDPIDRRYYSQTNSCSSCGISISLYDNQTKILNTDSGEIIHQVSELWVKGKIVAIKGIGGYLLTCDASNKKAIQALRRKKHRPAKPFALMYPNTEMMKKDVMLEVDEEKELKGSVSPILLVNVKKKYTPGVILEEVAPGLDQLGAMLPYTPLYALLLEQFGSPVVATSGNVTNAPIVFEDDKALSGLSDIADYVVLNDREIAIPQDDSVISFSNNHRQKIIIRRSRGFAPTYINPHLDLADETILATGAMLKSTFCYLHSKNIYSSQYLGDLQNYETEQHYKHTLEHLIGLFDQEPELILADKHPDYFSTRYAAELFRELGIPVKKYQHHKAHFAAVLGERNLIDSEEPVLGIVWDGVGLGDDEQIWGGEFFTYQDYVIQRRYHFGYKDFILGDKMSREPRISALSMTHPMDNARDVLKKKFSEQEWDTYQRLLQKPDNLKTSSVGRLFDAVSSLLGLKDISSYEGEAAMLLEKVAVDYLVNNEKPSAYGFELADDSVSISNSLKGIVGDIKAGKTEGFIAARFHITLIKIVDEIAEQLSIRKLAFSGGVFQNALLVDLIIEMLGGKYSLHFHEELSPNDENISFGQLMCYEIESRYKKHQLWVGKFA